MSSKRITRSAFVKGAATAITTACGAILVQPALASESSAADSSFTDTASSSDASSDKRLYTTTVKSIKGPMTVAVLIEDGKIAEVNVADCVDTKVISDTAIADVSQRIVDQQNVEVDVTAGATFTSLAIESGVSACLEAAGLNLADFQKGSDAIATEDKENAADEDFDMVIVGAGFAGFSAAIQAVRSGVDPSRVVILEKEGMTGGCSRLIGGSICAVNDTPYNQITGRDVTLEEFEQPVLDSAVESGNEDFKKELLSRIYDTSHDVFTYLFDNGVLSDISVACMDYNWGQKIPCFQWSKFHQYTWEQGDSGILDEFAAISDGLGVEVRTNSTVTGLVTDGSTVSGVEVENLTSTYTINCKTVILATGGFTNNQDLVEQYNSAWAGATPFCAPGNEGDGILLTQQFGTPVVGIGGSICFAGLNQAYGWFGPTGNLAWQPQVVFDANGRYLGSGSVDVSTLVLLPGSRAYGVIDSASPYRDRCEQAYVAGDIDRYDTIEDLANAWGIDPDAIQMGCDEFGVSVAPFYDIPQLPLSVETLPGIQVDTNCQVLDGDGNPVGNLYAAGMVMFGNLFDDLPDDPKTGECVACWTNVLNCACTASIAVKAALGEAE